MLQKLITIGKPQSTEDVRSFLQAAAFNAKLGFDHTGNITYEEATKPLRILMTKNAVFKWDKEKEQAYQNILNMMNSKTTLRPYDKNKTTHFVSDASPEGISASLYQEQNDKSWEPVDHVSRALSEAEQGWKSQIEWESLGKSWGMLQFRHYLVGTHFNSWGEQQPLLPFYNDLTKQSTARINKHRMKVQDLSFTDHYIPGK